MNLVVSYKSLGMLKPFHGSSFGHALSKVYYYATINKVCWGLSCAYTEGAQVEILNALFGQKIWARGAKFRNTRA